MVDQAETGNREVRAEPAAPAATDKDGTAAPMEAPAAMVAQEAMPGPEAREGWVAI
jgi:hypothetical protein